MKQINYFFVTLAIIIATTFSINAQSDQEILTELAKGIDIGFKEEMNKPEWKGIMTKAESSFNGNNIVTSIEYTYTPQNTTQENINLLQNKISAESIKTIQAQSISSLLDVNPEIKQIVIDIFKRNKCSMIFYIDYIFPTKTKSVVIKLTADDLSGKTTSKEDIINLFINNYSEALKNEIGKNDIIDAKVEYDGSNIVMTYVLAYDKDVMDNLPMAEVKDSFITQMKSDPIGLNEMRQLKHNNIDLIIIYTGENGGVKSIFIETDNF